MESESMARYEPLLELARGGMGMVYLARCTAHGKPDALVVMKRLHAHLADDDELIVMLRDEARIASRILHPNVVPLLDFVDVDAHPTLIQEYVESCTLASLLGAMRRASTPIPLTVLSRILCDALDGLDAAHEARDERGMHLAVVHRDASPQNILVGVDGRSRVIDFGIAKSQNRQTTTRVGVLKGKASYVAPEQILGGAVDRRADVFAIGVVLHEGVTGRRLFDGDAVAVTLRRILDHDICAPSSRAAWVTRTLDALVLKALAREPSGRFLTARAFRDALAAELPPSSRKEVAALVGHYDAAELARRRSLLAGVFVEASEDDVTIVDARTLKIVRERRWAAVTGSVVLASLILAGALTVRRSASRHPSLAPTARSQGRVTMPTPTPTRAPIP